MDNSFFLYYYLSYFLNASFHLLIILFLSSGSAYTICYITNTPFINPNVNENILKIQYKNIKNKLLYTIINSNLIYFLFLIGNINIYHAIPDAMPDAMPNENVNNVLFYLYKNNLFQYILIYEFIYYFSHRLFHNRYFYQTIHKHHHQNIIVYPIDFLDITYSELLIEQIIIYLPLFILNISYYDFLFIKYLYYTTGFLIHSSLFVKEHTIHHKYFKYNFCYLIPIYDIIFGTYK
jgi:Delta7-sterol 5-desaturase